MKKETRAFVYIILEIFAAAVFGTAVMLHSKFMIVVGIVALWGVGLYFIAELLKKSQISVFIFFFTFFISFVTFATIDEYAFFEPMKLSLFGIYCGFDARGYSYFGESQEHKAL